MERDTSEFSLETSSYLFRSLDLGGGMKTPLLIIYPWQEILSEDLTLPKAPVAGEVEVVSLGTDGKGRAVISFPGVPEGLSMEVLKRRWRSYLSGEPLEGRILLEGEEHPLIIPPPHIPPVRGHHISILESALVARRSGGLLYTPHTLTPENAALHLYTGADVMDNLGILREVLEGFLYRGGRRVACGGEGEMGEEELVSRLKEVTLELQRALEGAYVEALHGDLRLAAEVDAAKSVETALWLRDMDERFPEEFERRAPTLNLKRWDFPSRESLRRPQVKRWRWRLKERYRAPEGKTVLLLLPCSATKPYSTSPTHRLIRSALSGIAGYSRVHEVILTSPLGVVPRELEELWPARSYEVPVRGRWFEEEVELIRELLGDLLRKGTYERIFWLLPSRELYDAVSDLGEMEPLFGGSSWNLSREGLKEAAGTLREALEGAEEVRDMAVREEVSSLRFQLGEAADTMGEGALLNFKRDRRELIGSEGPLCRFLEGRGKHYLTLKGGERLYRAHLRGLKAPVVEIEDFTPRGKVFLQGIAGAEDTIRPGDEVVVVHSGEVRAVGEALLPGEELKRGLYRGVGVKVREALKG